MVQNYSSSRPIVLLSSGLSVAFFKRFSLTCRLCSAVRESDFNFQSNMRYAFSCLTCGIFMWTESQFKECKLDAGPGPVALKWISQISNSTKTSEKQPKGVWPVPKQTWTQVEQFQWKVGDSKSVRCWLQPSDSDDLTWQITASLFSRHSKLFVIWTASGCISKTFLTFMFSVGWIVDIVSVRSDAALESNIFDIFKVYYTNVTYLLFGDLWLFCGNIFVPISTSKGRLMDQSAD